MIRAKKDISFAWIIRLTKKEKFLKKNMIQIIQKYINIFLSLP